ncbi:MAG: NADH-quinone oxidoreductase subunit NuoN [Proteobacteria bacterium]|nr:NADH-quinone oxidoreductase subunit NuoN [Pseudomonadota bacterium]HQR04613.1 NADH-quinone oxidoreductase subunit NuoN [Rhodocyclaceae bacterium]
MLNQFVAPDLYPAAPEIFLLAMACVILFVDLLASQRRWITPFLSVASLVGAALLTVLTASEFSVLTFSNTYINDALSSFLKLLTYLSVATALIYGRGYLRERNLDKGEYYLLALFATLGMMVMISANHFLVMYLGIELLSLSLYAMVAMDRESVRATEAAMKYFVLGALASGLLLYGMSMVYGATGSLEISVVAQALEQGAVNKTVLVFGLVFLVSGIAFKLGVVPFHMWIPDVYHGAPTSVTLFIGSAPKLAGYALAIRFLVSGLLDLAVHWQTMLLILAVFSIVLGNLAAIAQTNIKRMLAYSTISHMGFMLLALTAGVQGGNTTLAFPAYITALYYVVAYVLMALASFGMIILLSRKGFEAEELEDFKGLNKRSPWFALMMLILMFSLAGIPFFIGFWAKFAVLTVVVASGKVAVAVFAVIMSLIGAFYYLRVVKCMYFDSPRDMTPIQAGADLRILLSINSLAVALLGVFPQKVIFLCQYVLVRTF